MTDSALNVNPEMLKNDIVAGLIQARNLCLPCNRESKYPDGVKWNNYKGPISLEQFKALQNGFDGVCIITGQRSGNLEVLDFDAKIDPKIFNELLIAYKELVESDAPGLFEKLVIEKTQSGGRHFFYKCPEAKINGNQKLAYAKIAVNAPGKHGYNGDTYTARQDIDGQWCIYPGIIETRGEGGLIVCHPTPGYELTQGDIRQIPDISAHDRDVLIRCAEAFNQFFDPGRVVTGGQSLDPEELRPGDDFFERGDIAPTLEKHGWTIGPTVGKHTRVRRPGKTQGWSATLVEGKVFYVFSTNTEFEDRRGYTIYAVYAILEHGGDYKAATKDLSAQGYGGKKQDHTPHPQDVVSPPPPFPIEALPNYYRAAIEQAARAYAVPLEVPAATLLFLIGALVGRSIGIVAKTGWVEHPNLYVALLAVSGMGKSPVIRAFMRSIFRIEKKRFDQYQEALKTYEEEMAARKRAKKDDLGAPPEKPVWKQIYVEDATEEALTDALSGNPKGILWYADELAGLLLNLGRYRSDGKSDGPKARLMSAYDCGPWKRTRKSGDDAYISHACLSILGTLQPAVLPRLFDDMDAASGFLPRFIIVKAEQSAPPYWTDETLDGDLRDRVDLLVESLIDLKVHGETPIYIGISGEAKTLYRGWYDEQVTEPWVDFDARQYEALAAKLCAQCLRVALILHITEHSAAGTEYTAQSIQPGTMQRAIMISDWIKANQRYVWQALAQPEQVTNSSPLEKRIAAAIVELESEIHDGKVPTARIAEKLNEGADRKYQVTARSVGKAIKKIGLLTTRSSKQRMVMIPPDKLQSLKTNVTNVTNVREREPTREYKDDISKTNVTNVISGQGNLNNTDDICDVSKTNVTAGNLHEPEDSDVYDVCDVTSGDGKRHPQKAKI